MKKWRPAAVDDVPTQFDDEHILAAMHEAKMEVPSHANFMRFADSVRKAVAFSAEEARRPTHGELYWAVDALGHAAFAALDATSPIASDRLYDRAAVLLADLLPEARQILEGRSWSPHPISLPSPEMLRDPSRRADACKVICGACFVGMAPQKRRTSRSRTWHYQLCIRPPRRGAPSRDAIWMFVMCLQAACCNAGIQPSWTADPRKPGPFPRLAQELLERFGAPKASAVEIINELDPIRKEGPWVALGPDHKMILANLKTGPKTQTQRSKLFERRHVPKQRAARALMALKGLGRIIAVKEASGGRPRTVWKLITRKLATARVVRSRD